MSRSEALFDLAGRRVWVAGHSGMLGSAVMRRLQTEACEILTVSHREVDLCHQADTQAYLDRTRPDVVIVAAAKVGGILANSTYPADFLYDNLMIASNVIEAARRTGVKKLLYVGSSCIYPKFADQPITEEALLTGALEPTNEAYAIAKIAGIKLCQAYRQQYGCDFIAAMPTNLYGPADNFDLASSHVVPALMRRFHEARLSGVPEVIVWGTGTPRREFLYVDDLADAVCHLLARYSGAEPVNVGTGIDVTIRELAETLARVTGYTGRLGFDPTKPDGTPRKVLDVSRATALGFVARVTLEEGVARTYEWFLAHAADYRR